jgi:hypothetical protein
MRALDAFAWGVDGWLVSVYDQTTNNRHLEEAAAANQGQIVDGVTEKLGGFPITHFDGVTERIWYDTGGIKAQPMTVVIAFYPNAHVDFDCVLDGAGAGGDSAMAFHQVGLNTTYGMYSGAGGDTLVANPFPINNVYIATALFNGGGGSRLRINSSADENMVIGAAGPDGLTIATSGNRSGPDFTNMNFYEVLAYDANMSAANRLALHRNVNAYYRGY